MIEWIKLACTYIIGFASCGLIQFFVNRKDTKNEKYRENLGIILTNLSSFGNSLHKAYNAWSDNINKLEPLLDEHIEYIEKYNQEVKNIRQEGNKLIDTYKSCLCEHAPTCPLRVVGEDQNGFNELLKKHKLIEDAYICHRKEFISKCIEIIDSITPSLSEYSDFLSHIPGAYLLPSKLFKRIYPFLYAVEQANTIISQRIRLIKSEPEYIGDKDRNLRQPILNAIKLVEAAKLRINEIITEL